MRIVVLGGAGTIGRSIVADLAPSVDRVVVADNDHDAAKLVASKIGLSASAHQVDVSRPNALAASLDGADACINSVNYYLNLEVMRACLEAGVPYLDLGGLFHMTRRQLELHDEFMTRGLTAVLGIGSCPGVANVQAGWLAGMLDTVESVRIYNGSTQDRGDSLAAPYAIDTILDEISMPAMVFHKGRFEERPPLSGEELYSFPEPVGPSMTHLSLHSEVATIPTSLADKGIKECSFKITFFGYSEASLRKLQFLMELGLGSTEPIDIDGMRVRPRDVLTVLLRQLADSHTNSKDQGYKAVVTEAVGTADSTLVTLTAETLGGPQEKSVDGAGKRLVSGPAAIVGRWLAKGQLNRPGVWPPEQIVEPEPFFAELEDRGFATRLVRSQSVADRQAQ